MNGLNSLIREAPARGYLGPVQLVEIAAVRVAAAASGHFTVSRKADAAAVDTKRSAQETEFFAVMHWTDSGDSLAD